MNYWLIFNCAVLNSELLDTVREDHSVLLFYGWSKLYSFTDSQWKKRCTGTIRIFYNVLFHSTSIVMWSDQVRKVCPVSFFFPVSSYVPGSDPEMVHIRPLIGLRLIKTCTVAGTIAFFYCRLTTTDDWEMLKIVHGGVHSLFISWRHYPG